MSLTLNHLLQDFPHISLASPEMSDELLAYYHQTELAAKESAVIYRRDPDFFAFLQERSEKFLVFILRDDQGKLQGVAVASFRPGYIHGEKQMIGYLGDLRVSLNRKLIREWRAFYGLFIERSPELFETGYCRYFQTALMSTNAYSKNNLADTKIPHLHYKELARYQMINIIGLWGKRSTSYQIVKARPEDKESLVTLLERDHQKRLFGHDWTAEFDHRLSRWKNFQIDNWVVVKDQKGNLLAATSLWNPIATKQILVPAIPLFFKVISTLARLVPGLTLKALPKPGVPIDILYLNQVSFAADLSTETQAQVLRALISFAFNHDFNMLAYCNFERENLIGRIGGLITQKNQMGFYTVHYKNPEGHLRDELFLTDDQPSPAFDMALV